MTELHPNEHPTQNEQKTNHEGSANDLSKTSEGQSPHSNDNTDNTHTAPNQTTQKSTPNTHTQPNIPNTNNQKNTNHNNNTNNNSPNNNRQSTLNQHANPFTPTEPNNSSSTTTTNTLSSPTQKNTSDHRHTNTTLDTLTDSDNTTQIQNTSNNQNTQRHHLSNSERPPNQGHANSPSINTTQEQSHNPLRPSPDQRTPNQNNTNSMTLHQNHTHNHFPFHSHDSYQLPHPPPNLYTQNTQRFNNPIPSPQPLNPQLIHPHFVPPHNFFPIQPNFPYNNQLPINPIFHHNSHNHHPHTSQNQESHNIHINRDQSNNQHNHHINRSTNRHDNNTYTRHNIEPNNENTRNDSNSLNNSNQTNSPNTISPTNPPVDNCVNGLQQNERTTQNEKDQTINSTDNNRPLSNDPTPNTTPEHPLDHDTTFPSRDTPDQTPIQTTSIHHQKNIERPRHLEPHNNPSPSQEQDHITSILTQRPPNQNHTNPTSLRPNFNFLPQHHPNQFPPLNPLPNPHTHTGQRHYNNTVIPSPGPSNPQQLHRQSTQYPNVQPNILNPPNYHYGNQLPINHIYPQNTHNHSTNPQNQVEPNTDTNNNIPNHQQTNTQNTPTHTTDCPTVPQTHPTHNHLPNSNTPRTDTVIDKPTELNSTHDLTIDHKYGEPDEKYETIRSYRDVTTGNDVFTDSQNWYNEPHTNWTEGEWGSEGDWEGWWSQQDPTRPVTITPSDNPHTNNKIKLGYAGTVTHVKDGWNPVTKENDTNERDMIQGVSQDGDLIYGYFEPNQIPDFGQFLFDPTPTPGCEQYTKVIKGKKYAEIKILNPVWADSSDEENLMYRHILRGTILSSDHARGEVIIDNPATNFPKSRQVRHFFKSQLVAPCRLPAGTEVELATSVFNKSKKVKIVSIRPIAAASLDLIRHDLASKHKEALANLQSTRVGLFIGGAPDTNYPTFPTFALDSVQRKTGASLIQEIVAETLNRIDTCFCDIDSLGDRGRAAAKKTATNFRNQIRTPFSVLINPLDFWDITEDDWAREIDKLFRLPNPRFPIDQVILLTRIDDAANATNISKITSVTRWTDPKSKILLESLLLPEYPLSLASYFQGQPVFRSDSRFNLALACFSNKTRPLTICPLPLEQHGGETDSVFEDQEDYIDENIILVTRPKETSQENLLAFDKLGLGQVSERPTSTDRLRNFLVRPHAGVKGTEVLERIGGLGSLDLRESGDVSGPTTYNPFYTFPAKDFFQPTPETLRKQTTLLFKDPVALSLPIIEALARVEGGPRPFIHPIAFSDKEVRVQCESEDQLKSLLGVLSTNPDAGVEGYWQISSEITWLRRDIAGAFSAFSPMTSSVTPFTPHDGAGLGYLEGVPLLTSTKGLQLIGQHFGVQITDDRGSPTWVKIRDSRPLLQVFAGNQASFYQTDSVLFPSLGVRVRTAPPPHPFQILQDDPKERPKGSVARRESLTALESVPDNHLSTLRKLKVLHSNLKKGTSKRPGGSNTETQWVTVTNKRRKRSKRVISTPPSSPDSSPPPLPSVQKLTLLEEDSGSADDRQTEETQDRSVDHQLEEEFNQIASGEGDVEQERGQTLDLEDDTANDNPKSDAEEASLQRPEEVSSDSGSESSSSEGGSDSESDDEIDSPREEDTRGGHDQGRWANKRSGPRMALGSTLLEKYKNKEYDNTREEGEISDEDEDNLSLRDLFLKTPPPGSKNWGDKQKRLITVGGKKILLSGGYYRALMNDTSTTPAKRKRDTTNSRKTKGKDPKTPGRGKSNQTMTSQSTVPELFRSNTNKKGKKGSGSRKNSDSSKRVTPSIEQVETQDTLITNDTQALGRSGGKSRRLRSRKSNK